MEWRVVFSARAETDLAALPSALRVRILEKIKWFVENCGGLHPAPLHGEWSRFAKLRVGDWRVVYTLDFVRQLLTIEYIDRRDKIYKRRRGQH